MPRVEGGARWSWTGRVLGSFSFLASITLFSAACSTGKDAAEDSVERVDPAPSDSARTLQPMEAGRLLTRISLDLRGVRPGIDELRSVRADPAKAEAELDAAIERYLADPRFEERMVDLFAEIYLTRADAFTVGSNQYNIDDRAAFTRAVGEEPLRLVARVAASDLPWTEIVTADWTMANEALASAWYLPYPADGQGWQQSRYTDGRPAAGVLATNGLWWRYGSTSSNANRKRANQASRILLCNDYLVRPIDFARDVDLLDEDAVNDAINNNPGCVNCHVSLDPFAAYFFGFWAYNGDSARESSLYHPERERLWDDYLAEAPGFYGEPGSSLGDLGRQIASDSRFPACATTQIYEALLRRGSGVGDMDALTGHREAFLASGLQLKALIRSVLHDPRYRSVDTANADALGGVPTKLVTVEQLGAQIEALTGFSWTNGGIEMLGNDQVGVRTLAGGADGDTVVRSATQVNATMLLVQARLAEAAATHAAWRALEEGDRSLFTRMLPDVPRQRDPEAAVGMLQDWMLMILGREVAADGEEITALLALYDELYAAEEDPTVAWVGVLVALLRDPDLLLY
ncbi:MAG: hypothetical protein RL071_2490 [Pseudomonadota bacterium]